MISLKTRIRIDEICDEISHTCDGPVTSFVLISRAIDLVKSGTDPSVVSNALHLELCNRHMLKEGYVEPSSEGC